MKSRRRRLEISVRIRKVAGDASIDLEESEREALRLFADTVRADGKGWISLGKASKETRAWLSSGVASLIEKGLIELTVERGHELYQLRGDVFQIKD